MTVALFGVIVMGGVAAEPGSIGSAVATMSAGDFARVYYAAAAILAVALICVVATEEKPFRLVAAPARTFLNSTFTETPSSLKREARPTALINPEDCAALGIADGDRVEVGNERGKTIVHAKPKKGQQRGVVVVEGIWPNRNFETGIGINAVTSAEPGWPNGGAVFHDTAVWIRKA